MDSHIKNNSSYIVSAIHHEREKDQLLANGISHIEQRGQLIWNPDGACNTGRIVPNHKDYRVLAWRIVDKIPTKLGRGIKTSKNG